MQCKCLFGNRYKAKEILRAMKKTEEKQSKFVIETCKEKTEIQMNESENLPQASQKKDCC